MERDLLRKLLVMSEERLRAICEANDRNGEFDQCERDEMVGMILRWAYEEDSFSGDTLQFLLGLAP